LQQFAANGQVVLSEPTWEALSARPDGAERLAATMVKGRDTPVRPYRLGSGPV
jgi:class 3 adenylate cyclase